MKRICLTLAFGLIAAPVFAADVNVSVGVNQPGLYGRIDIGQAPVPPVLVYPQPMIIVPGPATVKRQPVYLHVPPGQARKWRRYCGRYNACGQPVYFVREDWYQQHYRPHHPDHDDHGHRDDHDDRHDHHDNHGKGRGPDGRGR